MAGGSVVSISQRGLVTANIADRDQPAVLAEVALAWPVEQLLDAGKFLIQIEDGNRYGATRASIRVSPADATEQILTETDLGGGSVRGAQLRDGRLVILRETGSPGFFRPYSPTIADTGRKLRLDVYDASSLPAIRLLGSAVKSIGETQVLSGNEILWPGKDLACVLIEDGGGPWLPWVTTGVKKSAPVREWRGKAPELLTIDLSRPGSPAFGEPVALGSADTSLTGARAAKDGLLVVGTSDFSQPKSGKPGETRFHARVVSFSQKRAPQPRSAIDLPGSLFGVTELNHNGFLAFTRSADSVQVSACDGYDAFLVDQTTVRPDGSLAVSGRRLFVGNKTGVANYRLQEAGALVAGKPIQIGWSPAFLRCVDGVLLATDWTRLFAADVSGAAAGQWQFPGWSLRPEFIAVAADGDLLVPFGDYGAERLAR
jgi:hypothetical protein